MKLNISQEMLDKLKRLKGKIALFTAATATVIGLAGCTNTDDITLPSDAPITSEMPSSEVASSSEEMSSEEVSEELPSEELPSEDVVVEDVYSAESIMKLADELAVKYPIENPEHIKATLIMVNLDKITEEDRVALFDAYGFTYETLETTMLEFFDSLHTSHSNTVSYYQGAERLKEFADFNTRISSEEFVISTEDKEYARLAFEGLENWAYNDGDATEFKTMYADKMNNGYSFTDAVVTNYYRCSMGGVENYDASLYEIFDIEIGKVK